MATAFKTDFPETRSERLVVLVSPSEKRAIEARARRANLSLSDFVREVAQSDELPTEGEKVMLSELFAQIGALNSHVDHALERLEATEANADMFDEAAYKAKLEAEWTRNGEVDWDAIKAAFSGAGFFK